jgi:hypothetical protein
MESFVSSAFLNKDSYRQVLKMSKALPQREPNRNTNFLNSRGLLLQNYENVLVSSDGFLSSVVGYSNSSLAAAGAVACWLLHNLLDLISYLMTCHHTINDLSKK